MKMSFQIAVNDYNQELFVQVKKVLEQREGESPEHIILKMLAAALYYEPDIAIEPHGIDQKYKPDLCVENEAGQPKIWVECGKLKPEKLVKLTRRYRETTFLVVKQTLQETQAIANSISKDVHKRARIYYQSFSEHFIAQVAQELCGKNDWVVTISDNQLELYTGTKSFSTTLYQSERALPQGDYRSAYGSTSGEDPLELTASSIRREAFLP